MSEPFTSAYDIARDIAQDLEADAACFEVSFDDDDGPCVDEITQRGIDLIERKLRSAFAKHEETVLAWVRRSR